MDEFHLDASVSVSCDSACWLTVTTKVKLLYSKSRPVLIYVLELGVQGPLIFHPVGEDVSHGAAVLVKAKVEAIGVDLRTVCDLEHRLEANSFLSYKKQDQ